VKAIIRTSFCKEKTAMKYRFRIFALDVLFAAALAAWPHGAFAATTSAAPSRPPAPGYNITKRVDLSSPKLVEFVSILSLVLLP
jgi:hypothetical protein